MKMERLKYFVDINKKGYIGMKKDQFYRTKAWKMLSKLVKLERCSPEFVIKCDTCGKFMNVTDKRCHAGHFIKVFDSNSSNFAVAFEKENIGVQCSQCNYYEGGRPEKMEKSLERRFGKEAIERLRIKKHNVMRLNRVTLEIIADNYESELADLITKKGNPWKKK